MGHAESAVPEASRNEDRLATRPAWRSPDRSQLVQRRLLPASPPARHGMWRRQRWRLPQRRRLPALQRPQPDAARLPSTAAGRRWPAAAPAAGAAAPLKPRTTTLPAPLRWGPGLPRRLRHPRRPELHTGDRGEAGRMGGRVVKRCVIRWRACGAHRGGQPPTRQRLPGLPARQA